MTTYNLLQPIAHDLTATRWNVKLDTPAQYTLLETVLVKDLHRRLFGYELRAVPHHPKRARYSQKHDVGQLLARKL